MICLQKKKISVLNCCSVIPGCRPWSKGTVCLCEVEGKHFVGTVSANEDLSLSNLSWSRRRSGCLRVVFEDGTPKDFKFGDKEAEFLAIALEQTNISTASANSLLELISQRPRVSKITFVLDVDHRPFRSELHKMNSTLRNSDPDSEIRRDIMHTIVERFQDFDKQLLARSRPSYCEVQIWVRKIAQFCPLLEKPAVDGSENPADRKMCVPAGRGGWGFAREILALVLSQLDCPETLSNFTMTNKAHHRFVSEHAEDIWGQVVYNTCGHDIVKGTRQSIQERAKATVDPFYGKRRNIRTQHPLRSEVFDIAKSKHDRLYLRVNANLHQLGGESLHNHDNLVPLKTSSIEDIGLTAVKAWAEIHPLSRLTLMHIPFQEGQFTLQIHKNLYAVCILSRTFEQEMNPKSEDRNLLYTTRSRKPYTLVFFKRQGASIAVIHSMATAAFQHGQVGNRKPTALVAVGPAVLCVRVSASLVHCFGPEVNHGDQHLSEAYNPVDFRRVLRGELPNFKLSKLLENLDSYDNVTGMMVILCILESRNSDLCKTILEAISTDHMHVLKLSAFSAARDSMLHSAVQKGDIATVQYLLDNGCTDRLTVRSSGVLTLCMDKPEMAEVIFDLANKGDLDTACSEHFDRYMNCKHICEPVLHILKRNNAALFDSGHQLHPLTRVIAMCAREQDPGRLVMHVRFLRTLISLGSPMPEDDWKHLKNTACPRAISYLYTMDALKTIWYELNGRRTQGAVKSFDQAEQQWRQIATDHLQRTPECFISATGGCACDSATFWGDLPFQGSHAVPQMVMSSTKICDTAMPPIPQANSAEMEVQPVEEIFTNLTVMYRQTNSFFLKTQ